MTPRLLINACLEAALFAGIAAVFASFASISANPPSAKAHKGYVDFYSPANTNLYWEVKRSDQADGDFKTVFSKLKPLPDGVLRLELNPGPHQFQITFLNRLIEAPLILMVPVQEGMVTPVRVELLPVAETSVQQKQEYFGPTFRGSGRKLRYSGQLGTVERILASIQSPVPYQPKEQVNYPP